MKVFWVDTRLAFGSSIQSWDNVRSLHRMGVTHVVNLRHSRQYKSKLRSFRSLWLPFSDNKKPRPNWFYRDALRFFKRALQEGDSKVYVMCHHGICRSASLTYFLLRASGSSQTGAESVVFRVRPRAVICREYREGGEIFLALAWANKRRSGIAKAESGVAK